MKARSGLFEFLLIKFILFDSIKMKANIILNLCYQNFEDMTNDKNNIGDNIKKLRAKLDLTQDDLARKSGVKYTTLSKIEAGVVTKPTVHIMAKIAKALDVLIEDLIK
jgi:DNA-binding XRE family transcriptional regulator